MSIQVQHRRDTRATIMTKTPAAGEIGYATDTLELTVGDGATAGGAWAQKKNFVEVLSPSSLSASQNDFNPTGYSAHTGALRLTSSANINITGLSGGASQRVITLYNAGASSITLTNNDASSLAANRFSLGAAVTMAPNQSAKLVYDGANSLWYCIGVFVGSGFLAAGNNLSDLNSPSSARTNLGLGGAAVANIGTGAGTVAAGNDGRITGAAQTANNLSDMANISTARSNLGLGSAATANTGTSGAVVPLLNGANTFGAAQTFGASLVPTADTYFGGAVTPPALSASVNDYAPTGLATASILRLSASGGSWNVTGIASTGFNEARNLVVINVGSSNSITLKNQSASSASANRLLIGSDIVLGPSQSAHLIYDATAGFWVAVAVFAGTAGVLLASNNLTDVGNVVTARTNIGAAAAFTSTQLNALDYGIVGNGIVDDSAAINTFLTTCSSNGAVAYFPAGKTYLCGITGIVVPDGVTVRCGRTATFVRNGEPAGPGGFGSNSKFGSPTNAFIQMGNYATWEGGVLNNTAVLGTSTTSSTLGSGTFNFTTQAGLDVAIGQFIRVYRTSDPTKWFDGTATTYTGTTLTCSFPGYFGSGTFTDWSFNTGGVNQAAMSFYKVTRSRVEGVRITGNWYIGILFQAFNPPATSAFQVTHCIARNCLIELPQNRGIYIYGTATALLIEGCQILGGNICNYGINFNPSNSSGSANLISRVRIDNCYMEYCSSQGLAISEQSFYNQVSNCIASNITGASTGSDAFLIQTANGAGILPQYNNLVNCLALNSLYGFEVYGGYYNSWRACSAIACTSGGFLISGSSPATNYHRIDGCNADGTTAGPGFWVGANANHCDLLSISAVGNSTYGVQIDTGATTTMVSGHSYANTSANLHDSGTTTSAGQLLTT